jgi:peptidoglycan L-alanyl-D-glutamate endopeptidase CwlK
MDKISLDRISNLHPRLREDARVMYKEMWDACTGIAKPRLSYTLRTWGEQAELYAQGRTKPGKIVTWAKPGYSWHNYGLAFDIVLIVDRDGNGLYEEASWDTIQDFDKDKVSDWMECVRIAKAHGYLWGGDWNNNGKSSDERKLDMPHFEKTFGLKIEEAQRKFNSQKYEERAPFIQL